MNRIGYVFLISLLMMVVISYAESKGKDHEKGIQLEKSFLTNDPVFAVAAFGILGITTALYAAFW